MSNKIYKRQGKHGTTYQTWVELPRDPETGRRRQKVISGATKKEVEALAVQMEAAINTGGFGEADADKVTLAQYIARWLPVNASSVRATTHRRYADLLRLHVLPYVGRKQLSKLSALDLQHLYAHRHTDGHLSMTTVQQIHIIIHKALKQAVKWGLLVRNPADAVEPPRRTTAEMKVWTRAQAAAFLAVADEHEQAALWRLALLTGMRRGEILGLRWEDIDLRAGTLSVRRTCIRGTGNAYEFAQPKTAKGRRQISLTRSTVDALNRHRLRQVELRLRQGSAYQDEDLVFATPEGHPLHPNTLALHFSRLIEAAGVPRIRFHDLRHTSATLMLANGEHPKIVQERLGHADIGTTLNRYSHVTMDMQRDAADRLDKLMGGSS